VILLDHALRKADIVTVIGDALKLGMLGSLMICKVGGKFVNYPSYYVKEEINKDLKVTRTLMKEDKKHWDLALDLIRQEDYVIDPHFTLGRTPLYEGNIMWMDIHQIESLAESNGVYDKSVVKQLGEASAALLEQEFKKSRETGHNMVTNNFRHRIKVVEFWGNVIDPETGKLIDENMVWTIADDKYVLQKPEKNKLWHGESPFVTSPILRVPFSVWHRALMDAPTLHNIAMNELYNLILDGGLMEAHGIKQVRPAWLEDPSAVENGITPGMTLAANSQCPPGAKVLERVDTAAVSSGSLNVFQLVNNEFNQSSLTNDLRMGTMPSRAVKATEVVEASQTITSVTTGITKVIEVNFIDKLLRKSWLTEMQSLDIADSSELVDLLGEARAQELGSMSPEERFARTAVGVKFKANGVSSVLGKMKDFKKLTALMQTIFSSDILAQSFLQQYSPEKFLDEILYTLDIKTERIKITEEEKAANMLAQAQAQAQTQGMPAQGGVAGPNVQSQIPQAGAAEGMPTVESQIPRSGFAPTGGDQG
jgi:hypothetical protein